jgi:hypothetical protein
MMIHSLVHGECTPSIVSQTRSARDMLLGLILLQIEQSNYDNGLSYYFDAGRSDIFWSTSEVLDLI